MKIVKMTSEKDGENFYCKLGRFFCSEKITLEMGGYQIVDDPYRIWMVAFEGSVAVGFCSFSTEFLPKGWIKLCDSFIDEPFRRKGVYSILFEAREKEALKHLPDGGKIKGIALKISELVFERHGYIKKSQRGRFAYMEKEVKGGEGN